MGLGYFFANPDKKEYFNPALKGGYLRRNALFKEELHLCVLKVLLCEFPNENSKLLSSSLKSWSRDRLLVLSDNDWSYPKEPKSETIDVNGEYFNISEYRDITTLVTLYLIENETGFAEQFISQLSIDSDIFMELVNFNYRAKSKTIEKLIVQYFGKSWEKKYHKSFIRT